MDKEILSYMDNEETARHDIQAFMNLSFPELCPERRTDPFKWIDELFQDAYDLDTAYYHPNFDHMNYVDLFAHLNEYCFPTFHDHDDDYDYDRIAAFEMSYMRRMTEYLLKQQYSESRVRLFLATPLKLYYSILSRDASDNNTAIPSAVLDSDIFADDRSDWFEDEEYEWDFSRSDWIETADTAYDTLEDPYSVSVDDVYNGLMRNYDNVLNHLYAQTEPPDTIGEMLSKAVWFTNIPWNPINCNLQDYGDAIRSAYSIFRQIFLCPFSIAYPDRYGASVISNIQDSMIEEITNG